MPVVWAIGAPDFGISHVRSVQDILDHLWATKTRYDQQARLMVLDHLRENVP
jgi:hypothetical protein